ncbi:hypothetical protein [Asticcacaulis excentricus]|uniref:Uncharacterized protein n=1 Tax=Asticcacaulis excentricus (strain ATCC 15261 / DSM 4724 / KCTC 12464 / NCIMB 9791 / VKM B-1370 / CB 48) TaxID=573065 RepID=E8RTZ3_ASTEC|nr:hypothetical protein [Asticcacaulis excentricus]ADU14964.1 hypothetical protein Astex_3330 [Asticcacaulis excentricus CB 48]
MVDPMKMTHAAVTSGRLWRRGVWSAALLLWLVPLIAMRVTTQVQWTAFDFAVFGAMLIAGAGAFDLVTRLSGSLVFRAAAGVALLGAFLLVWINLAVGMLGSEDNPANLIYALALAVGGIGAVLVRFQARGLAGVMLAVAGVQAAVAIASYVLGYEALVLNGSFVAIWLLSAWLFHMAAKGSA